jgi:hypothetical protein
MSGQYLCETCFDEMTNHIVDVRGFEEAVCDGCIGSDFGEEEEEVYTPENLTRVLGLVERWGAPSLVSESGFDLLEAVRRIQDRGQSEDTWHGMEYDHIWFADEDERPER